MSSVCPGHGTLSGPVRVVPNSALRRVILQGEQVVEAALDGVLLGEYAPGTGPSPLALVEEEGLFDPGKAGKQRIAARQCRGAVNPDNRALNHSVPNLDTSPATRIADYLESLLGCLLCSFRVLGLRRRHVIWNGVSSIDSARSPCRCRF